MLDGRLLEAGDVEVYCRGLLTTTPSPHSEQTNASIDEKCGNVLSAPQCVQWALQITSVVDRSSIVLSISPTGTVRITSPHSLQRISALPSRIRTIRQPQHSTSATCSCG